jgi:hypothetical protein
VENKIDSNKMFGEVVDTLLEFPEEIIFLCSSRIDSKYLDELIMAVRVVPDILHKAATKHISQD